MGEAHHQWETTIITDTAKIITCHCCDTQYTQRADYQQLVTNKHTNLLDLTLSIMDYLDTINDDYKLDTPTS